MTSLAPHGGCNWEGCKECFPPVSKIEISTKQGWHVIRLDGKIMASTDNAADISALVQKLLMKDK